MLSLWTYQVLITNKSFVALRVISIITGTEDQGPAPHQLKYIVLALLPLSLIVDINMCYCIQELCFTDWDYESN